MDPGDKSKLRTGYTTGACAAAAARAACEMLTTGADRTRVTARLPNGKRVTFELARHERHSDGAVTCAVEKDAGDDPDCTHGAHLTATVRKVDAPGIRLAGGEGVGTITRPGLGLAVGAPAINPVPRENITANMRAALGPDFSDSGPFGVEAVISVPGGEEMAAHTLNARLGITGGISILGTTGIVRPYSTAAFKASVTQGIQAAAAAGCDHLVLTTGGRSEKYAQVLLPDLPEAAFIQMGDFVAHALKTCAEAGIGRVTIVGMIGKLSKLADGRRQTHAKGSEVNMTMLARLARQVGAGSGLVNQIAAANTGRHAMELAAAAGLHALADAVCARAARYGVRFAAPPSGRSVTVSVIMTDFDGAVQGRGTATA